MNEQVEQVEQPTEIKKINVIWDASQLDMFELCDQRFYLRYVLNKGPFTKAPQLDRGTLLHNGYEVYYKELQKLTKPSVALELCIEKIKVTSMEADLDPTEVGRIVEVAEENLRHWEFEDQTFEILAVEEPFIYLLFEDEYMRIYMTGKIDLLINWHTRQMTYERLPVDHKSYDRKWPLKRLSNQFMNYCYAAKSDMMRINRVGFQASLEPDEKHIRQFMCYDELILEQWRLNVVKIAQRYVECVAENSWPMNFTSCDKFNRQCEYANVCESSGEPARLFKIGMLNDIEPWDVTKILEKK
jgi:hypothetical protein